MTNPQSEVKCKTSPHCSHNTNGRDLDKPCSVEFPHPKESPVSQSVDGWEKDSIRLKWLHSNNKDADGYEYGVMKVKYDEHGHLVSAFWTASDHSDIDPLIPGISAAVEVVTRLNK